MVTAVAIGARALLPPEEVRLLRGDGMAALFYVANWRMIFRGGDYFAQTAAPSPLEHTWSLGIEEQFYLLWPLVLGAVLYRRRSRRRRGALPRGVGCGPTCGGSSPCAVVGAVASTAALAATYSAEDPGRAYYGTDTRGAAILIGAALAALLALRSEGHTELYGESAAPATPRSVAPGWRRVGLGGLAAAAAVATVWAATHAVGHGRGALPRRDGRHRARRGVGDRARGPGPVGVVRPAALGAAAPGAGSDLVRRLPVALAGVHRRQRGSDRTGRPDPVHGALPADRGHRLPLLRAGRTPDPAPGASQAPGVRRDRGGRRGGGRGRGVGGDDRGASTAGAAGGDDGRRRGGQLPRGRRRRRGRCRR